jgi:hypothetical protein
VISADTPSGELTDRDTKQSGGASVKLESLWGKKEVREYLAVSARTLDYWIASKLIPHIKFPGAVRFIPVDVRNWVESRRVD